MVGGVHWLSTQHLYVIASSLQRSVHAVAFRGQVLSLLSIDLGTDHATLSYFCGILSSELVAFMSSLRRFLRQVQSCGTTSPPNTASKNVGAVALSYCLTKFRWKLWSDYATTVT